MCILNGARFCMPFHVPACLHYTASAEKMKAMHGSTESFRLDLKWKVSDVQPWQTSCPGPNGLGSGNYPRSLRAFHRVIKPRAGGDESHRNIQPAQQC